MKKTLELTLYRVWFDQILEGTKKIEYREIKAYWTKRLFNSDGSPKQYDEIMFTNGYGSDRPKMRVKFLGVREKEGRYEILLGEILEVLNV